MAGLIVKSPYYKCDGKSSISGYMSYIATRERVELIPDDRPPTRKQEQLIAKLTRDFPDVKSLYEYGDYMEKPTKANASALITLALESNWEAVQKVDGYAKYIATRPRVERLGEHGLFGDEDNVDLQWAMSELDSYTGNVWTHILSLHRDDATRLGYDNAEAWRNLLRAHRNEIAAAMKIPPEDFRWYAAFHDEGDHPHCHMMAWSVNPGQAYLSKDGIRSIRSELTNAVFRMDMFHLYEQKSQSRDELVRQARMAMKELVQTMATGIVDHPVAEKLMQKLAEQLEDVKGKKSYGYLPKSVKKTVDEIVDQMERISVVSECYDKWLELQGKVESYYHDKSQARVPLSQQKEFRQIKNAVIQEAENIRLGKLTFEDREMSTEDEPEEFKEFSFDYWGLQDTIRNERLSLEERDNAVAGMKEIAEAGDVNAQYLMGKLWRDGPLLTPDSVNARYWFMLAAEQGHASAQYALSKLLLSKDMEVRDPEQGIRWLERSVEQGNPHAHYRLGKEYLKGEVVEKDTHLGMNYIYTAALDGHAYAQYLLGKLLLQGQIMKKDREEGLRWLEKAAEQGHSYAQFFVERQSKQTPPNVILGVSRVLHHMSRIFRDNALPQSNQGGLQIDRKRRKQLQRKRIALGHKPDDHEDQRYSGPSLSM